MSFLGRTRHFEKVEFSNSNSTFFWVKNEKSNSRSEKSHAQERASKPNLEALSCACDQIAKSVLGFDFSNMQMRFLPISHLHKVECDIVVRFDYLRSHSTFGKSNGQN